MAELKFPDKFFWGSATASYQVEGGIENNDWAQAARDGKVPIAGLTCDHYNRYEEDFDIAKKYIIYREKRGFGCNISLSKISFIPKRSH